MDSKKLLRSLANGRGSLLVPHIDAYQSKGKFPDQWVITLDNKPKERSGRFYPSTHATASIEQIYLDLAGKLKSSSISPTLRRTFDVGHFWHQYLQAMILDMGMVKEENIEIRHQTTIHTPLADFETSGRLDLKDVEIPGSDSWLIDIKSMRKQEFEAGPNPRTLTSWKAQINIYGDWAKTDRLMVLAVCKDSPHELREFIIEPDTKLVEEIYNKWAIVKHCLDTGITPDQFDTSNYVWYNLDDSTTEVNENTGD
jgi:hypothetical protein